jgi:hypothetical protein
MQSIFLNIVSFLHVEDSAVMGISPLKVLRIQQGFFAGVATFGIIVNSIALRGAIKRNPRNIRVAFRIWVATAVTIHVPTLLHFFVKGKGEATNWQVVEYFVSGIALTLLDGWAMFVYMRDMKGQKRDSYGFLVEDKEQADPEKESVDEQHKVDK